jgi:hypothetical protein
MYTAIAVIRVSPGQIRLDLLSANISQVWPLRTRGSAVVLVKLIMGVALGYARTALNKLKSTGHNINFTCLSLRSIKQELRR